MQLFEAMVEYKCDWERVIKSAVECDQQPPEPLPHPDDIIVDLPNARAVVCGPSTKEEKERWDRALEYVDEMQIEVSYIAAYHRRSRNEEKKARALENWKFHQKLFDRINDNLPKRYRRTLKDRCWERDASRPGSERKRIWPGEA